MTEFEFGLTLSKIAMSLDDIGFNRVKGYLKDLEHAAEELYKQDWIFCDDQLPDKEDSYLVLWKEEGHRGAYYEIQQFCSGEWCIDIPQANNNENVKIIAWREFPDMPKEIKDEQW